MRLLTIVLSLLVFAGCQQAPTGPQGLTHADREQITALTEAHIKAVLANDASAEAALYTEDTVLLPPGQEMVRGKAEMQKWVQVD